ncbi:MAG: Oxidoreductase domain-containing protein [Candidatus Uhrbacteria bacterium GW2011_GWF2_39_13]|uniref:Oxidoreductase domain-containing protein n=1 Tax=Candidatus Uhrbacteria bacterium GW2011_GWF2_39_13 TaxID=1618995 RepID=A0A0G0MSF1_9BACT|nr:MAG: Oxidoreductase domain-containing protein [Candidatus Uhrbacteria bacterium GW2011_GWF2_39_13]
MNINAAVIGCGNISQYHFSGLEKCGARVSWVCDINQEAAKPWMTKFNARFTEDYRKIIADPEVNTVVVTLLSGLHKDICTAAIAAGKAVICEKTLAENPADAWEICTAAQIKGTILYTSYMKRFIPAVEKAKELIPGLGRILSTYIRAYQCWGDLWSKTPTSGAFYTPPGGSSKITKKYGGGILVCGGSHILDLVLFLIGRPHRLFASVYEPAGQDYDLQASALMETAERGIVYYEALAHPLKKIGYLRDGWDERVEINGINGRLEIYSPVWSDHTAKGSLLVHYDNVTGNTTEYRFNPISPFDKAVEFFCNGIKKGEQGTQSVFTGYEVDELIEHIKLSSKSKKAVDITWRN